MIYLMIILIAGQIIHIIHLQIIQSSLKRRLKIIDFELQNLNHWVVSNQHACSNHLEQIQEMLNNLYVRIHFDDLHADHRKSETATTTTFSWLVQAVNKEPVEKLKQEEIEEYYSILLQEMQDLYNKIGNLTKQAVPESPLIHEQLVKTVINNRLNGNRWLKK